MEKGRKKVKKALVSIALLTLFAGCSIKKAAFNSVADMLAPPPSTVPAEGPNPMIALTGESDPELVRDFFPTALKIYEMMHLQNPEHPGLAIMTGQLYIMYAAAFVQAPAERLPSEQFDVQDAEYRRAQVFYVRGANFALKAFEHAYPGFGSAVFSLDEGAREKALSSCVATDGPALYWAGAGLLGAFSLSPLDSAYLERLPGAVAMLERSAKLAPEFNDGAAWEALAQFYAVAPDSLGGGKDKAVAAFDRAFEISGGKNPSTFVAYARSLCIPTQDSAGFDENIDKALAIDPESDPDNRLALVIARRQALWLKAHKADFILEQEF